MTCDKIQAFLPDIMFDSTHVPADVRQHLVECSACRKDLEEMQDTIRLLDMWEAPEPSPYFSTRMAARLREEKISKAPGWLERMRSRLLFDGNLHLRPAITTVFALLLVIIGAGSYEGFVSIHRSRPSRQTVSATVTDLELLDSNAQTLQELAAFDNSDAAVGQGSSNGDSK